jgi:hypothetical protein
LEAIGGEQNSGLLKSKDYLIKDHPNNTTPRDAGDGGTDAQDRKHLANAALAGLETRAGHTNRNSGSAPQDRGPLLVAPLRAIFSRRLTL